MNYIDKNSQLYSNLDNKGRREEKSMAKKYGLKPTVNSGAVNDDGDFSFEGGILETKCGYKTLLIHKWIKKLLQQSRQVVPNKKIFLTYDSNGIKFITMPFEQYLEEKK